MGRLFLSTLVFLGFSVSALAVNEDLIPVRRCRNNKTIGEEGAIDFTVLMDSRLCNIDPRVDLSGARFTSALGNRQFSNSILLLDHTKGSVLSDKWHGVVLQQDYLDAKKGSASFNACLKLDRVFFDTLGIDRNGNTYVRRRQFIQLSVPTDVASRDVTHGIYYRNYIDEKAGSEALTCEFVDQSLLRFGGLSSESTTTSGSTSTGPAIVIPQEEKLEAPSIVPAVPKTSTESGGPLLVPAPAPAEDLPPPIPQKKD